MKLFDVYPLFDVNIVKGKGCKVIHNLVTSVKVTYKNGESRVYALCESERDFIIAHGYHRTSGTWDNGIYMPKYNKFSEVQALKNFIADIEAITSNESIESIRF